MSLLQRFLKDRRGGITPMFALAIIPVVGLTGAAIDYSRANSVRSAMQAAADSAALMLSKDASTLTPSQLATKATAYFNALFNRSEAMGLTVTPTYSTTGGSSLTITASASVNSSFMKLMGYPQLNIGTTSVVKWGNQRLRVALVLDNTGSMADAGKMTAMQAAAKSLLTQLKNAATTNGDVYVSIIPFSKDVNVGSSNYNQTYLRWDLWDAANGGSSSGFSGSICYSGTLWVVSGSGFTNGGSCSSPSSGICYNGTLYNWNGSNFTTNGSCTNHQTWNGCVTDRDQDYDTTNTAPSSTLATQFPAEQFHDCPVQLMPLSYDWSALNSKIDSMTPGGMTNQTIGLQWGFQSLTAAPFTIPAKDPNYTYQQVVILLTDGLNTQNRFSTDQTTIDARTKKVCDNIKNAGIVLYALQVNTSGDPTSTMLQGCASDASKFFLVTSSSQIGTIFNQIGTNLSKLRISK